MANDWRDNNRRNMDDFRNEERRGGLASTQSDRTYDPQRYRNDENREWRNFDRNEDRNSMDRSRSGADYGSFWKDDDRAMNSSRDSNRDMNWRDAGGRETGRDSGRDSGRDWNRDSSRNMARDRDWNTTSNRDVMNRDWGRETFNRNSNRDQDHDVNNTFTRSYDWGSATYGNRNIDDRNFGREWDRGAGQSALSPGDYSRGDYSRGDFRSGTGSFGFTSGNDYVARTAGLESGRNHVGRGPKGYRRSDDRIREDASDILERHPDIDASEIEIEVKEGVVTLRGHVEDRRTKRMAEDSVEHINGVKDVRNELAVNQSLFERAREFFTGESSASVTSGKTDAKRSSRH